MKDRTPKGYGPSEEVEISEGAAGQLVARGALRVAKSPTARKVAVMVARNSIEKIIQKRKKEELGEWTPPRPKEQIPAVKAGDKVIADRGTFEGKTGIVVKMDKSKSSELAKLRMIVKLDKGNKKVSVVASEWKKT